jgi:hypothetical protein
VRISRLAVLASFCVVATLVCSGPALAAARPTVGYDVSYPQCSGRLPKDAAFGIVGVSDGLAYGENPCLAQQYAWASGARKAPAFYMNTGNPGVATTRTDWYRSDGPRTCDTSHEAGCAYNYGFFAAGAAFDLATDRTGAPPSAMWWLDVETANSWSADAALNLEDIQGSIDYLTGVAGVPAVGIYSTGYQWGQITGGARLPVPSWVAGALNAKSAPEQCAASFTGGPVHLVQYWSGGFDADYACP